MALEGFGERDYQAGNAIARGSQKMFVPAFTIVDSAGNEAVTSGGTPVGGTSGNVANASAAASLAAVAGKTNYLTGVNIHFSGATAASVVNATITGLIGGTMTIPIAVPAGATVGGVPVDLDFAVPIPASAVNTAITVTLPALGAGNTNAAVYIRGFQK